MSMDAFLKLPEDPQLLRAIAAQQQVTIEVQQRELEQLKIF